jgi:hypothetical protein
MPVNIGEQLVQDETAGNGDIDESRNRFQFQGKPDLILRPAIGRDSIEEMI